MTLLLVVVLMAKKENFNRKHKIHDIEHYTTHKLLPFFLRCFGFSYNFHIFSPHTMAIIVLYGWFI